VIWFGELNLRSKCVCISRPRHIPIHPSPGPFNLPVNQSVSHSDLAASPSSFLWLLLLIVCLASSRETQVAKHYFVQEIQLKLCGFFVVRICFFASLRFSSAFQSNRCVLLKRLRRCEAVDKDPINKLKVSLIQDRFLYCHGCCTIPATFVSVLCTHCFSPFQGNSRKTIALFIVLYRTQFPGSVIVTSIVQIIFRNIIPGKTINSPSFFCVPSNLRCLLKG